MPRRFGCGVIDIPSEAVLGARYSMCSGFKIMHQRSPLDQTLKIEVMSWTSREQNRVLEQNMLVHEDVCELFCLRKKHSLLISMTFDPNLVNCAANLCRLRGDGIRSL